MKVWPMLVAVLLLGGALGVQATLSRAESVPERKSFVDFPLVIGRWQGKELGMNQEALDVLKLSDYMMRLYGSRSGEGRSSVLLYVGYYQSQRTGSTYHSPRNCLPGAGWQFMESKNVVLPIEAAGDVTINEVLIQKGLDRQVILYWYQDRGRVIASEYAAKAYLVLDAMRLNRTDGALIRVSVPVTTTPEAATEHGMSFVQDVWPVLQGFLPPA